MTTIIKTATLILRSCKNTIITCLSLALLCSCTSDHIKQVAIPNTEIKQITAAANNVPYKLFISLPEGYSSKGHHFYRESYPVLSLLDPDVEFGLAENIARLCEQN